MQYCSSKTCSTRRAIFWRSWVTIASLGVIRSPAEPEELYSCRSHLPKLASSRNPSCPLLLVPQQVAHGAGRFSGDEWLCPPLARELGVEGGVDKSESCRVLSSRILSNIIWERLLRCHVGVDGWVKGFYHGGSEPERRCWIHLLQKYSKSFSGLLVILWRCLSCDFRQLHWIIFCIH